MFSPRELSFFEKLFNMESGHVLDFSRDGLKNFIRDSVNLDAFTLDYSNHVKKRFRTDSMANTLKYFWETEDFDKTLKLVSDLVDYYESEYYGDENEVADAKIILNRYYSHVKIKNDYSDEKRIIDLINEINHIIDERLPIFAVDKLHTLTQFIFRQICDSHNITYKKTDGIDSLFKKYVQFLNQTYDGKDEKRDGDDADQSRRAGDAGGMEFGQRFCDFFVYFPLSYCEFFITFFI